VGSASIIVGRCPRKASGQLLRSAEQWLHRPPRCFPGRAVRARCRLSYAPHGIDAEAEDLADRGREAEDDDEEQ